MSSNSNSVIGSSGISAGSKICLVGISGLGGGGLLGWYTYYTLNSGGPARLSFIAGGGGTHTS